MAVQADVVSPLKRWLTASLLNKLTLVCNIFFKVHLIVDIGLFILLVALFETWANCLWPWTSSPVDRLNNSGTQKRDG